MDIRVRNVAALGLLVLVAVGVFVWGLYYLLGDPVLAGGTRVYMSLENGAGLKRGDRVYLNGVDVGLVRRVALAENGGVVVELRLEENVRLPADTRAAIAGDVFGAHTVDLIPGTALVTLEPGDTIEGAPVPELTKMLGALGDRAREVLGSVDSLLSPQAVRDVHATAAVLPASAEELRKAFVELHLAAAALRRSVESVEGSEPGPALARALAEVEGSAKAINSAAQALERSLGSLASVLAKVDRGDGTLGLLVNDTTLYRDLQQAVREMRALAADVRERPGRYVTIKLF
ncbi:MAG TPA: MlaD family protein [Longimicrobiales bacterium]